MQNVDVNLGTRRAEGIHLDSTYIYMKAKEKGKVVARRRMGGFLLLCGGGRHGRGSRIREHELQVFDWWVINQLMS